MDRTGCAWRTLRHVFPPWSLVYYDEDSATKEAAVDYVVASLSDFAQVPGYDMVANDVDNDLYISLEESRQSLEQAGFTKGAIDDINVSLISTGFIQQ